MPTTQKGRGRRRKAAASAVVLTAATGAAAIAAVVAGPGTAPNAAIPAPPAGFTTTWSDDFDGAAGTGVDTGVRKYDTGPGSFGTGEIDPQGIQVDLGAAHSVSRAVLNWEAAYGRACQPQISSDAATWTTIWSTTTGTGGIQDLPVSGSGRYVRLTCTQRATQYGYSLWELQVYGT